MLIRHEGKKLKPYKCPAGKITIGVGRNLQDVGISEDEALFLMRNDIKRIREDLSGRLTCWGALSEERKDVLINMAFNMGIVGLMRFKKMLAHIAAEHYAEAAEEMLKSVWARQVGNRAKELAKIMREE